MKIQAWLMIALLAFGASAQGARVIVPNFYADFEGPAEIAGGGNMRYQQIYDYRQFWQPENEPRFITGIAFRPGGALPPGVYSWTLTDVEVFLSTTDTAYDELSTTYADNFTADRTLVFHGPITFSSTITAAGGPHPFDFAVPLQSAFAYTPDNRNLIVELINHGAPPPNLWERQMDYVQSSGVTSMVRGSATHFTGAAFVGEGLITEFTTSPIPEPSRALLLAVGVPLAVLVVRLRTRRG